MKNIIIISLIFLLILSFITLYKNKQTFENTYEEDSENILYYPCDIYVKKSMKGGKYGRGVYANRDFEVNETIELAPYIEDKETNTSGIVRDYTFSRKGNDPDNVVIAFGFASLYNHDDDNTASWVVTDDHVKIYAVKPIKKGEEIFITYGSKYWESRNDQIDKL
jgi:hypothetical protein